MLPHILDIYVITMRWVGGPYLFQHDFMNNLPSPGGVNCSKGFAVQTVSLWTDIVKLKRMFFNGPLARYAKLRVTHAPGMPGTFSRPPLVSDPDMHHGTCVTHVPWCMPGSLTSGYLLNRRWGKTFPSFPAHAQPAILRIW